MKTLEEFAIKEIQDLRKQKEVLETRQEKLLEINNNLGDERDAYKNKYIELITRLKEDFNFEIKESSIINPIYYIKNNGNWIWSNTDIEKYEFYKNTFNLKEGE